MPIKNKKSKKGGRDWLEPERRREFRGPGLFGPGLGWGHPERRAERQAEALEGELIIEGTVALVSSLFAPHGSKGTPKWKLKENGEEMSIDAMIRKANEIKDRFLELKDDKGKLVYDGLNKMILGFDKELRYTSDMPQEKRQAYQNMGIMNTIQTLKLFYYKEETMKKNQQNYFIIPYQVTDPANKNSRIKANNWEKILRANIGSYASTSKYIKSPFIYVGEISEESFTEIVRKEGCNKENHENKVFIDGDGKFFLNKYRWAGPLYCDLDHIENAGERGHHAKFKINWNWGEVNNSKQGGKTKKNKKHIKKTTNKKQTSTKKPIKKTSTKKSTSTKKPIKKTSTKKSTSTKKPIKKTTTKKPVTTKKPIKKTTTKKPVTTRKTVKKTTTKKPVKK